MVELGQWVEVLNERDQLKYAIQRVRELHEKRHLSNDDYICVYDDDLFPCATIEALDGEQ